MPKVASPAPLGMLERTQISVYSGDVFDSPQSTGKSLALGAVVVLTPTVAGEVIALWNNFRVLAAKLGDPVPN